ncbi:MAG: HAD family hydrolase [bacterium]|nr:HAD family hydrolase [bacterium]
MKYQPEKNLQYKVGQKKADTVIYSQKDLYAPTESLRAYAEKENIPIVGVSGRDLDQVIELQKAFTSQFPEFFSLLMFDALIGAVGTEIWLKKDDGAYELDEEYRHILRDTYGFKREKIYPLCTQFIEQMKNEHSSAHVRFQQRDMEITSTEEHKKQEFKISMEFEAQLPQAKIIQQAGKKFFNEQGYPNVKIVLSYQTTIDESLERYNLDILPCGKKEAVEYLSKKYPMNPIIAGDSGNDLDMLLIPEGLSIVVGNAKKELLEELSHYSSKKVYSHFIQLQLDTSHTKLFYFAPPEEIGPAAVLQGMKLYRNTKLKK